MLFRIQQGFIMKYLFVTALALASLAVNAAQDYECTALVTKYAKEGSAVRVASFDKKPIKRNNPEGSDRTIFMQSFSFAVIEPSPYEPVISIAMYDHRKNAGTFEITRVISPRPTSAADVSVSTRIDSGLTSLIVDCVAK